MSYSRPMTHESWYGCSPQLIGDKIESLIKEAKLGDNGAPIKGARLLIGPHAGYSFSGERLAETFKVWDNTGVQRIFLLGPSHHIYYRGHVKLSKFKLYETPFGKLPIDSETSADLIEKGGKIFKYMSNFEDEDEHSFEMHAPFIHFASRHLEQLPKLIPIMVSGMDSSLMKNVVSILQPYFEDESNHFIISSDFCHWGLRFGYMEYLQLSSDRDTYQDSLRTLTSKRDLNADFPIYKSIENLDRIAMSIISSGSSDEWEKYISTSGNTICGQKPIAVVLRLLESSNAFQEKTRNFEWIGYSQSDKCMRLYDNSVSYASGFVQL